MLEPDKLKIDRSFVNDLPDDADSHALVHAIIAIARSMSINVVGEGVETAAQRDLLLQMGCRLQQGYLHGRPMPAAALVVMLQHDEALAGPVSG